jgi:predicted metalloprotease
MTGCQSYLPGTFPYDPDKPPQCYDRFLVAAVHDIDAFWQTAYPELYDGASYRSLPGGFYPAYPDRPTPIPGCDSPRPRYREIEGNAYYCGAGEFIVYDDDMLFPYLDHEVGRAVIAVVLAHEFGHSIQHQQGTDFAYPSYNGEQQSDCFAGAWAAHVQRGEANGLTFTNSDVIAGLNGMIVVADPVGASGNDPGAHGSAFDRVRAFQDGFTNGVEICKPYLDHPVPSTLIPFTDPSDVMTGGDLPTADLVPLVQRSLDTFWNKVLAAKRVTFDPPVIEAANVADGTPLCTTTPDDRTIPNRIDAQLAACPATNTIVYNANDADDLNVTIGDFALAYRLGTAYADLVQRAMNSTLRGAKRSLLNDCLAGIWTASLVPDASGAPPPTTPEEESTGSISPGDLDEVVRAALAIGDPDATTNLEGTAFDKITAFRTGFDGSFDSCVASYG